MVFLFALTLFVSATLLFIVEPMFGKMVLPLLGGTPAIWNTCMVFFQAVLLAGYAYAHVTASSLKPRWQAAIHLGVVVLTAVSLPIAIAPGWTPPSEGNPAVWLLGLLAVSVGLPFFVISTTAPMVQKWFAGTNHPAAGDPYFLYAAGNCGSIVGLLGYLVILEPRFTLAEQGRIWAGGYALLVLLIGGCAAAALLSARRRQDPEHPTSGGALLAGPSIPIIRRLRWVALAFIPSSLMLGVTTYLTTDIAVVPLLWVTPLMLYLLSFILTFARRPILPRMALARALPFMVLLQMVVLANHTSGLLWLPVLHLVTFFVIAMICHGELAGDRPSPEHLTGFYLLLSLGGVLGGIFNALVAPIVFTSVVEYPLVLVLACVFCLGARSGRAAGGRMPVWLDAILGLALGIGTACALLGARMMGWGDVGWAPTLLVGLAAFICYTMVDRPVRFALGLGAVVLAIGFVARANEPVIYQERSFFGVLRVEEDTALHTHSMIHGTTLHGMQSLIGSRRDEPLTYYYPTGPIGQVFRALNERGRAKNVAIIGLGTGSMACYAHRGASYTFYEIDPAVKRVASDPRYFTYLRDCARRPARLRVVLGDARLTIRDAPPGGYDFIVLDAFSSDSIPTHLLTRQALQIYRRKLADHGLIAMHISNRHLDLEPVVGALAADAGMICRIRDDKNVSKSEWDLGKTPSTWALLASSRADMGEIGTDRRWKTAPTDPGERVWTDDFSNILGIIRWLR